MIASTAALRHRRGSWSENELNIDGGEEKELCRTGIVELQSWM